MPQKSLKLSLIRGQRVQNYDYRDSLPVNMTAISLQVNGDAGYMLSHDGLLEFGSTSGKARGANYNERLNKHFRISGNTLEEISTTGVATSLGVIKGNDTASLANSFNTQAIVSDGKLWLYDGAILTQITDTDLGFPIDITWFRGIYVMTDGESLFQTDELNEYTISPLKYASSEYSADPIKGVIRTDENQIIAFNRYSSEWFYYNANAPVGTSVLFPISGKSTKIGIVGTHCKCELDGLIFILGGRKQESPSVHIFNGSQESTIATREIDKIIARYTEDELQNVYMESRTVDRDKFVIIHLPNETLLYNHTIGSSVGVQDAWTYLKTGTDTDYPWRAKFGIFDPRISKWVYGDIQENKLATLDQESIAQYGESQECILYTAIIPLQNISINEFQIETINGFAPDIIQSAFSLSYNGVTNGTEYWNEISSPNDYDSRYICRNLGYIRDKFSMKFRFISNDKMSFSAVNIIYD